MRTPTWAEVNTEIKLSQGPLGIMLTTTYKALARSLPQLTEHLNDGWGNDGFDEAANQVLALFGMGISAFCSREAPTMGLRIYVWVSSVLWVYQAGF